MTEVTAGEKKKKKEGNIVVWSAEFREKIPISHPKTAQFKGSPNRSSLILTADTKQQRRAKLCIEGRSNVK